MTVATPASAAQITERPESVVFDGPPRDGNGVLPVCRRGQHRALEPDGQYFRTMKTSAPNYLRGFLTFLTIGMECGW
jgi:hypothetical protein